jgi:hypothetical protein
MPGRVTSNHTSFGMRICWGHELPLECAQSSRQDGHRFDRASRVEGVFAEAPRDSMSSRSKCQAVEATTQCGTIRSRRTTKLTGGHREIVRDLS